ncbi:MAG: cache domain-containing protein, partial [bacterium]
MIHFRSLRFKISLSIFIVALLPFLSLSLIFYVQAKQSTKDLLENSMGELSHEVGIEIERTIFNAKRHIKALSENPIIKSTRVENEEKLREMHKIQNFFHLFEDIILVNSEGIVIASTEYDYQGDWKSEKWFQQSVKGECVISPVHAIPSPFRTVITATAPLYGEDGKVYAVIGGQINMKEIWDITDRVKIGKTGFVFLIDNEGNLIASPYKYKHLNPLKSDSLRKKIVSHNSGVTHYINDKNSKRICYYRVMQGYQEYKGLGWGIGIVQDIEEAYAMINRIQMHILLVAIAGFIIIIILANLLSHHILKPIKTLPKVIDKIARGDLDIRMKVKSNDEIGDLGKAFNKMAGDLRRTRASL